MKEALSRHRAKIQRYAEMFNIQISSRTNLQQQIDEETSKEQAVSRPVTSTTPADLYEGSLSENPSPCMQGMVEEEFDPSKFKKKLEVISQNFKKHDIHSPKILYSGKSQAARKMSPMEEYVN